jgi:hypothetical protein
VSGSPWRAQALPDEQLDAAGDPGAAANEAVAFQGEDHLMN